MIYGVYLTLAATLLLTYVLWRLSSLPRLRGVSRRAFVLAGLLLVLLLVTGRWLGHYASGWGAALLEFLSMTLVGTLLLVFACLFPVDLLSGFGLLFRRRAALVRGWAMLAGCLLALLALFQGLRPPRVERYEVTLPGLPPALDGLRLVAISDLHLGAQIGPGWLRARVEQVQALKPGMILVLGDLFDWHGAPMAAFLPDLRRLTAPLGVWAVDGNHESYRRGPPGASPSSSDPLPALRDQTVQPAPGLFLAGRRYRSRRAAPPGRPAWNPGRHGHGATILMAHVPVEAEAAARAGVGLMLCGHTHGGQIWPLSIVTRLLYPLLAGRYEVEGMTVLVSRGAGTWGPRMRLWRPGDIMLVTLRSR
jgi:predicted MPP superfamily phosphohydrolase